MKWILIINLPPFLALKNKTVLFVYLNVWFCTFVLFIAFDFWWVCWYLPSICRWVMFNQCPSHHIELMRWRQLAWNLWFLVSAPKSECGVYFTNNLLFITLQNRFIFFCQRHIRNMITFLKFIICTYSVKSSSLPSSVLEIQCWLVMSSLWTSC